MERAGILRHVAMQISGHRTASVCQLYCIVVEADLKTGGDKLAAYHKPGMTETDRTGSEEARAARDEALKADSEAAAGKMRTVTVSG